MLDTQINDVNQFQLHLTNTDFKHYAEAKKKKKKSEYLDRIREKVKQDALDYQIKYAQEIYKEFVW